MAIITEMCPHCGKVVQGEKMRSKTNRNVRENIKEYAPIAGELIGTIALRGGLGKVAKIGIKAMHKKYKKQIDGAIDKVGDMIEDGFMYMNYQFTCPQCGHIWKQDEDTDIDEGKKGMDYRDEDKDIFCGSTNIYDRDSLGYDEHEPDIEESGVIRIEEYKLYKNYCAIRHYCLWILNSQVTEELDYTQVVNHIKEDIDVTISVQQIEADTRQDVCENLVEILLNQVDWDFDWQNVIADLPCGEDYDKYKMEVYDAVYIEGRGVEAFGDTLIGVNISGSIEVGDDIVICTTNGNRYNSRVVWIEMDDEKVTSAESGFLIGMGINIDLREIVGDVDCVYKYDEIGYEDEDEEYDDDEEEELTSEEQEFISELEAILADGEISPRERRLLEKIRVQLGISEERAAELENSLTAPQLTEEEQEYLDEYKEIVADGEITDKERRLLDKILKMNGISEERAREIEASVKR